MVAYSFQPRFIMPIQRLEKQQTIRLPRKRHARPGEAVQHFTGPRMRPTRLGASLCKAAHRVRLDFAGDLVELDDAIRIDGDEALNAFAIRDGFRPPPELAERVEPWDYMARFWRLTHPEQPVFAAASAELQAAGLDFILVSGSQHPELRIPADHGRHRLPLAGSPRDLGDAVNVTRQRTRRLIRHIQGRA